MSQDSIKRCVDLLQQDQKALEHFRTSDLRQKRVDRMLAERLLSQDDFAEMYRRWRKLFAGWIDRKAKGRSHG